MDEFRRDEFCFDQLKNLKAPSSFTEKALAIPLQSQKKKPFLTAPIWLAGVAAAVLMLLVGVGLFVNMFGNRSDLIKRGEESTITVTDPQGSVIAVVPVEKESSSVNRDVYEASGNNSAPNPTVSSVNTNYPSQHEVKEAAPNGVSQETKVTEQPASATSATRQPEPVASSAAQTQPLTEPCQSPSTEQVSTTATAEEPPEPNTGSHTEPTTDNRYFRGKVGIIFPNGAYSTPVYCSIISSSGNTICYKNNTTVSNEGVYTTAMFAPSHYGYRLRFGSYTAVFYSSTGAVMTQVSFTVVNESAVTYLFPVG